MNDIQKKILSLLKEKEITYYDLADSTGLSRSTLQRWVMSENPKIPIDKLEKIATALGVSTAFLLGWQDSNAPLPTNAYPAELCRLPVIGKVSAGNGVLAEDNIIGYELADARYGNGDYFYLKVKGDSMSPKIEDGDLVLIHKQDSVDSGNCAVVTVDNEEGVVKKVSYDKEWIKLESVNPYYPPRLFKGMDVTRIRVIGKVIGIHRIF